MSTPTNFPNILTLKVPKMKKNKGTKSSSSLGSSNKKTTPPPHPFSTCGPLQYDNEFFQFYAQLYQSALIFSNPKFQQSLLFPGGYVNKSGRNNAAQNFDRSPIQSSVPFGNKRHIKKAQRRLSGAAAAESNNKPSSCSTDNEASSSGGGSGGGSLKHLQSDFELFYKAIATSSTPAPSPQQENKKNKGKKEFKRRVSFSKASPRVRSRSNSNNGKMIPKITIEEHCWSSDMDETDTTESETDENASSTMGEGEDNNVFVLGDSKGESEVKVRNDAQELLTKFNELSTHHGQETTDAKNDLSKPEFNDA